MEIIYDSLTGNCAYIAKKISEATGIPSYSIKEKVPTGDYLLVTYTINKGAIPKGTMKLLMKTSTQCKGCIVSGDSRWGEFFGLAGDKISLAFDIPLISKLDVRGTEYDYHHIYNKLKSSRTGGAVYEFNYYPELDFTKFDARR